MFSACPQPRNPSCPALAPSVRTTALHTHRSLAFCTQTTPMSGPTRAEAPHLCPQEEDSRSLRLPRSVVREGVVA